MPGWVAPAVLVGLEVLLEAGDGKRSQEGIPKGRGNNFKLRRFVIRVATNSRWRGKLQTSKKPKCVMTRPSADM
jgi:hypothetical protein